MESSSDVRLSSTNLSAANNHQSVASALRIAGVLSAQLLPALAAIVRTPSSLPVYQY